MLIYRGIYRISRTASSYDRRRWLYGYTPNQQLSHYPRFRSHMESSEQGLGCRVISPWFSRAFSSCGQQPYEEDQVDPFSLVADELSIVANRLRSMVVTEVPKLASAAEYFFKMGVEGVSPTVLLLMATALNVQISKPASEGVVDMFSTEMRTGLQSIAEITEMIHHGLLFAEDILQDCITNSNSCKSIALLTGQTAEVAMLAYEYGKNLGLAFQLIDDVLDFTGTSFSLGKGSLSDISHGIITAPILYAIEEFPELQSVVDRGLDLDDPANMDLALEYLGKSHGIQRTRELAAKHANLASATIDSFPVNDDVDVQRSRRALKELTHIVVNRTK